MNELSLVINQNPGSIELNFDALEEQLDKKLSEYKGAVFTEDTKTIAKAEVANLRKLKKDIEDSRKAVKKKWMEPYDAFEKRMKVLSAKVEEPITEINAQVQAFEEERRKAKKEDVTKLFGQMLAEYEDYKEYISLEKLYDNRWENATASMKSIKAELTDKMNGIRNANKEREMRDKNEVKLKEEHKLNNDLISVYRRFLSKSKPLSEAWCDCYNALQLELYHAEILEDRK